MFLPHLIHINEDVGGDEGEVDTVEHQVEVEQILELVPLPPQQGKAERVFEQIFLFLVGHDHERMIVLHLQTVVAVGIVSWSVLVPPHNLGRLSHTKLLLSLHLLQLDSISNLLVVECVLDKTKVKNYFGLRQ